MHYKKIHTSIKTLSETSFCHGLQKSAVSFFFWPWEPVLQFSEQRLKKCEWSKCNIILQVFLFNLFGEKFLSGICVWTVQNLIVRELLLEQVFNYKPPLKLKSKNTGPEKIVNENQCESHCCVHCMWLDG